VGIFRPLLSWALCYPLGFGLVGAWIGLLLEQVLRLVLYFRRFSQYKWIGIKI